MGVEPLRECPSCGGTHIAALLAFDGHGMRYGCVEDHPVLRGSHFSCVQARVGKNEAEAAEHWNALPRRSDLQEACNIIRDLLDEWGPDCKPARAFLAKHKKGAP